MDLGHLMNLGATLLLTSPGGARTRTRQGRTRPTPNPTRGVSQMGKIGVVVVLTLVALLWFGASNMHLIGNDLVHFVHTFLTSASSGASS